MEIVGIILLIGVVLGLILAPLPFLFLVPMFFSTRSFYKYRVKRLPKLLKSANWQARRTALQKLNNILLVFTDVPLVELLVTALKDTKIPVQQEAAKALRKARTIQAIPPLLHALEEYDEVVQAEAIRSLVPLCILIESIIFGQTTPRNFDENHTVWNPKVENLTGPMKRLRLLVVHADSCDVYQVEQFLTYAVNYIGQQPLKKRVTVAIYGDPDRLHHNLRNSLINLCKHVSLYHEHERIECFE